MEKATETRAIEALKETNDTYSKRALTIRATAHVRHKLQISPLPSAKWSFRVSRFMSTTLPSLFFLKSCSSRLDNEQLCAPGYESFTGGKRGIAFMRRLDAVHVGHWVSTCETTLSSLNEGQIRSGSGALAYQPLRNKPVPRARTSCCLLRSHRQISLSGATMTCFSRPFRKSPCRELFFLSSQFIASILVFGIECSGRFCAAFRGAGMSIRARSTSSVNTPNKVPRLGMEKVYHSTV
jgi:hypothetical protein